MSEPWEFDGHDSVIYNIGYKDGYEAHNQPKRGEILEEIIWHVIKKRPLTDEELEYYDDDFCAPEYMFDCKMPEDGDEIIVAKIGGSIFVDVCGIDEGYYLEDSEDWDDVIAWSYMPRFNGGLMDGDG